MGGSGGWLTEAALIKGGGAWLSGWAGSAWVGDCGGKERRRGREGAKGSLGRTRTGLGGSHKCETVEKLMTQGSQKPDRVARMQQITSSITLYGVRLRFRGLSLFTKPTNKS